MGGPHPHGTHAELHGHGTADAVERAVAELVARGERVTASRRAVIEALAAEHEHRSAQDIAGALGRASPPVHRATVYRTLERLAELGIATRTRTASDAAGYHLAVTAEGHEHLHARCRRCGRLVVLPAGALQAAADRLRSSGIFVLEPEHSDLVGLCDECAAA